MSFVLGALILEFQNKFFTLGFRQMFPNAAQWKTNFQTNQHCRESCCNVSRLTNFVVRGPPDELPRLEEMMKGPGLQQWNETTGANSATATCEFVHEEFAKHFPHTMQQLYRCWSYFLEAQSRAKGGAIEKVLILPSNITQYFNTDEDRNKQTDFGTGFVYALANAFDVVVITPDEFYDSDIDDSNVARWINPGNCTDAMIHCEHYAMTS